MTPVGTSVTSSIVRSLFLPPITSSPFPEDGWSPDPVSLTRVTESNSRAVLTHIFIDSPSSAFKGSLGGWTLSAGSGATSPEGSEHSLRSCFFGYFSFMWRLYVGTHSVELLSLGACPVFYSDSFALSVWVTSFILVGRGTRANFFVSLSSCSLTFFF